MSSMSRGLNFALGAALLATALFPLAACGASRPAKPAPEVFDQEVVKIDLAGCKDGRIQVEPESIRIFYQWDRARRDDRLPAQARWVVKGLDREQKLHIVPKEGSSPTIFPFPSKYEGKPAFTIPDRFNSITSGEARALPKATGDDVKRGKTFADVSWRYDVIVTDRAGKVVCRVDPEIVVVGHP